MLRNLAWANVCIFALLLTGNFALAGDGCISSVPIAESTDNHGSIGSYSGAQGYIYYDYLTPVGNIVNNFVSNCQSVGACLVSSGGNLLIGGSPTTCDWTNNNSCPTMSGTCDGEPVTSADRMAFAILDPWGESTAAHYLKFSITSVAGSTGNRYVFNNATGTVHNPQQLNAPSLGSPSCDGTTCTLTVTIANPAFDSNGTNGGLYGDAAGITANYVQNLIAGYKVYGSAAPSSAAPTTGAVASWAVPVSAGQYIAYSAGASSSGSVSFTVSGIPPGNWLYISYTPVFNNNTACPTGGCTPAQVQGIDTATGGNLVSPYVTANSPGVAPTAVMISSFTARRISNKEVQINWVTATEAGTAGFKLYRSRHGKHWALITPQMIPAKGQGGMGASYDYSDKVKVEIDYVYKLVEITTNNTVGNTVTTKLQ